MKKYKVHCINSTEPGILESIRVNLVILMIKLMQGKYINFLENISQEAYIWN